MQFIVYYTLQHKPAKTKNTPLKHRYIPTTNYTDKNDTSKYPNLVNTGSLHTITYNL